MLYFYQLELLTNVNLLKVLSFSHDKGKPRVILGRKATCPLWTEGLPKEKLLCLLRLSLFLRQRPLLKIQAFFIEQMSYGANSDVTHSG